MATETAPLPSVVDRGADDYCHLRRQGDCPAACGADAPTRHSGAFWGGETTCPDHGRPICPACIQIVEGWMRAGVWEGP